MHRIVAVAFVAASLQGCAVIPWIQQHAAGIALTGTVLGTLAAGESVIINTKTIVDDVRDKD